MMTLTKVVPPAGVIGLLAEVLRGVPRLPGALCTGRHTLMDAEFDGDDRQFAVDSAAALCFQCPALAECGQWANEARVFGVVAGRDTGAA